MKKKLCALVLAVAMSVLVLTGCGGGGSSGTISGDSQTPGGGGLSIHLLGATWEKDQDYTWLYYCAEVTNTNSQASSVSSVIVTPKSKNGGTLAVLQWDTIGPIAGGDTVRFSGVEYYKGEAPEKVTLSLDLLNKYDSYNDNYHKAVPSSRLQIVNSSMSSDMKMITGTLVNNGSIEAERVRISVLFKKNGKYIGGNYDYVADVQPNGGKADFEINLYKRFTTPGDFDSYEIVAAMGT